MAIVELLLEKGAMIDGTGTGTRTALMTAAMFNRTEMVELLLARGADPARRDGNGQSAADLARSMNAADTAVSAPRRPSGSPG